MSTSDVLIVVYALFWLMVIGAGAFLWLNASGKNARTGIAVGVTLVAIGILAYWLPFVY